MSNLENCSAKENNNNNNNNNHKKKKKTDYELLFSISQHLKGKTFSHNYRKRSSSLVINFRIQTQTNEMLAGFLRNVLVM